MNVVDQSHENASLFARTLAMPREQFESVVIDKRYNVQDIADAYGVYYFPVQIRGIELEIWE